MGTARRRCDQAWRSCRRLRGCADRVSAAHAREQWRLSCEQENPKVRGGVNIANQSGSIVSSQESTMSNSSYSSLIVRARPQHFEEAPGPPIKPLRSLYDETSSLCHNQPPSLQVTVRNTPPAILHPLQSPGKLFRHPRNLVTVELFSSPILFATGIHFPPVLLHNQGYPKDFPDPLNLPNASDSPCRNIVIIFLFFVFPNQGLNFFDLESSRVFFVKFPEPSLFQISELLHSIEIHKKFIKIQNQFCLNLRSNLQVLCCDLALKVFDLWSKLNIRE
jgi:hypothetical protein